MQKLVSSLQQRLLYAFTFAFLLFITSCDRTDKPVDPITANEYLQDTTFIKTLTKAEILSLNAALAPFVKNDVRVYKITYKTKNTDGSDITASGAFMLPVTTQEASMVSAQHGTIRTDAEAPSSFQPGSEAATLGAVFASMGYIISYPDYIGYGSSASVPHPYEHRASLASASLDMLRAGKEFLKYKKSSVTWNNKLFIAGYSEGGYATMSLQKKIEDEASSEFNLRASSCGAGAYDKTAFMKYIVNSPTHGVSSYNQLYLWVLQTYDRIYKLNKPATYYFNEPWATRISQTGINTTINVSFNTILTDSFKKALADGTDTGFVSAIGDNDVYNWKPKTPTRLYHGDKDDLVFYFNSVNAAEAMKKQGAADVQLVPIAGGTHATSVQSFLLGTLLFFQGIN